MYNIKQFPWHQPCYGNMTYKLDDIIYWRKENPMSVEIEKVPIWNKNNTTKQSATRYGKLLCRPH